MKTALQIRVYGKVQGVSYRLNAKREAAMLGLTGFARNEPDSSVYIEVEGRKSALQKFLIWCREGSSSADVISVESQLTAVQNFEDFQIV